MKQIIKMVFFFFLIFINTLLTASSPDGTLDTSFGLSSSGIFNYEIADNTAVTMGGGALQSSINSNRLVNLGYTSNNNFFIAGITSSGDALDSTFAAANSPGGLVTTNDGSGLANQLVATLLLGDDSVVGVGNDSNSNGDLFAVKYTADGTLDTNFGNPTKNGFLIYTPSMTGAANLTSAALQTDGTIVAAGYAGSTLATASALLLNFDNLGNFITTFGTNGVATIAPTAIWSGTPAATAVVINAVAVQPSGAIVIGGSITIPFTTGTVPLTFVGRLTSSGAVDTTFNASGASNSFAGFYVLQLASPYNQSTLTTLTLDQSQNIVFAGSAFNANSGLAQWMVGRLTSSGTLDTNFSTTGTNLISPYAATTQDAVISTILIQNNQRILALGFGGTNAATGSGPWPIAGRFLTTGAVDTTFGSSSNGLSAGFEDYSSALSGLSTNPFTDATFNAGAIQTDGDVIGWGTNVTTTTTNQFFALRFLVADNPLTVATVTQPTGTIGTDKPLFAGTAQPQSQMGILVDNALTCNSVTPNTAGDWQCQLSSPLSASAHTGQSVGWYQAGNVNVASNSVDFTVESCDLTVTIEGSTSICIGSTLTLTAQPSGGTQPYISYSWTGPEGFVADTQSISIADVTDAQAGNYTVTVTDSSPIACMAQATADVTVNATATATITASKTAVCEGTSVTLTATLTGNAPFTIFWNDGTEQADVQSPATRTVTPEIPETTYEIIMVTDATGCSGGPSNSITIDVYPVPTVTLSTIPESGSVCQGGTITIMTDASGGTGDFVSYTFATPGRGSITQSSPDLELSDTTVVDNGTYAVTATDSNGCQGSATTSITIAGTARLKANHSLICPGDPVVLKTKLYGTAPFVIVWSDGVAQETATNYAKRTVNPVVATTYSVVSITDATGCTGGPSNSVTINVAHCSGSCLSQAIIRKYCLK